MSRATPSVGSRTCRSLPNHPVLAPERSTDPEAWARLCFGYRTDRTVPAVKMNEKGK